MTCKQHLAIAGGLLGMSCLVQAVVVCRATTTGLDAVGFVEMAQSIDRQGFWDAVGTHRQQPLFPAWVWVVHEGLEWAVGAFPASWAVSAQLAAAIPLVLAVVPLYLLLLRLVGPGPALAGALLFCVLPEVSRLGADGLSDSTHLLFFCVAFWAMVEYVEGRQGGDGRRIGPAWWMLLAGVAVAVAALARAEVLVLAAALGLTLGWFQLLRDRREAWGRLAGACVCLVVGLALVWAPYLAATGALTPRSAVDRVLGRHEVAGESPGLDGGGLTASWRLPDGEPASFDVKERSISLRRRGYAAAIVRFGRKLAGGFGYWAGAMAVFGAWRLRSTRLATSEGGRRTGRATAGDRFVQFFFLLFSVLAIRFSAAEGYLDPRHLLPLVVAGMGAAGYGALELAGWLTARRRGRRQLARYPAVAWAVVALAGVGCLPQTLARLHHSRLGHRAAAEWLARRAEPDVSVLDTQGWTALYSGRETYTYDAARTALTDPRLGYLVLEGREVGYDSGRSRTLCWLIEAGGEPLVQFPPAPTRSPNQQPVIVCRWHADRFLRRVQTMAADPLGAADGSARQASATNEGKGTGIAASAGLDVDSRSTSRTAGPRTNL